MSVGADFSRTCEGCENIREEPGGKKKTVMYRCFAPGPCQGYHMGTTRFFPYVPAWCPQNRKGIGGEAGGG